MSDVFPNLLDALCEVKKSGYVWDHEPAKVYNGWTYLYFRKSYRVFGRKCTDYGTVEVMKRGKTKVYWS